MRLRNLIPTKAKLVLFQLAVLPYLTYCLLVWHFYRSSDARKLERLQERGLRAVYKDKLSNYSQLLKRAELPTLINRRLQDICILMYRVKHRLCPTFICKHSLRNLGPKLWGKLSPDVRSAKTLNIFRKQIRKYDISLLIDDGCKGCSLCSS